MSRLLLTGAAGRIGRAIRPALEERWDVLATDLPGVGTEEEPLDVPT